MGDSKANGEVILILQLRGGKSIARGVELAEMCRQKGVSLRRDCDRQALHKQAIQRRSKLGGGGTLGQLLLPRNDGGDHKWTVHDTDYFSFAFCLSSSSTASSLSWAVSLQGAAVF